MNSHIDRQQNSLLQSYVHSFAVSILGLLLRLWALPLTVCRQQCRCISSLDAGVYIVDETDN